MIHRDDLIKNILSIKEEEELVKIFEPARFISLTTNRKYNFYAEEDYFSKDGRFNLMVRKALWKSLRSNAGIVTLDTNDLWVPEEDYDDFYNALKHNESIQSLTIRTTHELFEIPLSVLILALKENKSLTFLSLVLLDAQRSRIIAQALKKNQISLHSLYLTTNNESFNNCIAALKTNETVRSISFDLDGEEEAEDDFELNAREVEGMLNLNKTISHLTVKSRYRDVSEVSNAIAKALKKNTTLTALYIEGEGDINGNLFAEMIKSNQTLNALNIPNMNLDKGGEQMILEALQSNEFLTHFSVSLFQENSSVALARVLETNKTLTSVSLFEHEAVRYLNEADNETIIKAMGRNTSIMHFSFGLHMRLTEKNIKSLISMLKENNSLIFLSFSRYGIGLEYKQAIESALQRNRQASLARQKAALHFNELARVFGQAKRHSLNTNAGIGRLTTSVLQNIAETVSGAGFLPGFQRTKNELVKIWDHHCKHKKEFFLSPIEINSHITETFARILKPPQAVGFSELFQNQKRATGKGFVLGKPLEAFKKHKCLKSNTGTGDK